MGKLLPTVIQQTGEWLGVFMSDLMGSHIAPLGKPLLADIAREGLLTRVSPLMGLVIKPRLVLDKITSQ